MSTLPTLIGKPSANVFRRAYVLRRSVTTGLYETAWINITDDVKQWGNFESSVDAVRLNRFSHSGLELTCRNDAGHFNPETDANSIWHGSLGRFRSLVKIEAGYIDTDGTELPTVTTQGVYILSEELTRNAQNNTAHLRCKSLASIFDEVTASEVAGLGSPTTASAIIGKIRDHTDGAGAFVFRQFITDTAWTIQTTTTRYNLATVASDLENMTAWELMAKLAECEGFVLLVNRTGGIEFRNRAERTTTAAFEFYGQGFARQNVITFEESKDAIEKYYNHFRLKWAEAETATSYVEAGTNTTVDASSTVWKYGRRTYHFSNEFFETATTAQTVVDSLLGDLDEVKEEVQLTAKFLPDIEVLDKVTLSYHSYDLADQNNSLWDVMDWASDGAVIPGDGGNWALEDGENFDYNADEFKVLSKSTSLDNFTTTLTLRRI